MHLNRYTMNIISNSFSSYSLPFLKEHVLAPLTDRQKKILLVASLIFAILAVCWYLARNCLIGKTDKPIQKTYSDGSVAEGVFKNELLSGKGKKTFRDGTVWEGEFKDGELFGQGKMTYPTKGVEEGQFKNCFLNGQGRITYPDGRVLEGTFIDGIFIPPIAPLVS